MTIKTIKIPGYNILFDSNTGLTFRWGDTPSENPKMSPIGPEILDIEISKNGCPNAIRCPWCYKDNTEDAPVNMSLATFKTIFHKFRSCKALGQIALGVTGIQTNPDLIPIMEYCRSKDIVPNLTLTGKDLTDELAQKIAQLAGAVAISVYPDDKQLGYNTIKKLRNLGLKQVNMHLVASTLTLDFCYEVLKDISEQRVLGLGHVLLLTLKPKGRGQNLQVIDQDNYNKLYQYCYNLKIPLGMDSCSSSKFLKFIKQSDSITEAEKDQARLLVEPCESTLFSAYVNVEGKFMPCSFCEGKTPEVDLLKIDDFLTDIWTGVEIEKFRNQLWDSEATTGCRCCPIFKEIN